MPPIAPHRPNAKFVTFLARLFISLFLIGGGLLLGLWLWYQSPVHFDDSWMDAPNTQDPAIQSSDFLLSNRPMLSPTTPVCVLVHGFSASTYELNYLKNRLSTRYPSLAFSQVLMGGHGRDYSAFKHARYTDWQQPVIDEIHALQKLGYTNISLLGVSTGGTVLLNVLLNQRVAPTGITNLILVDPFLIPKNKWLYLTPYLKWLISNTVATHDTDIGYQYWYTNRPTTALSELARLIRSVQKNLNNWSFSTIQPWVIGAIDDPVSNNPQTERLLQHHIPTITSIPIPTDHHVIVEPYSKGHWSPKDQAMADRIIDDIGRIVTNHSLNQKQ